jgi:peptidoglycan-associated lipoprotein
MSNGRVWKWGVLVLAVAMVFSLGCAKKQTVTSEAPAPSAAAAGKESSAGVKSEAIKSEAAPGAGTKVAAAEAAAGMAVTEEKASLFQDIRFDFDKSFIRDDAKPTLAKVAEYMKKNAGAKLSIEGHCDERGTSEYNMALGDRRADSARKYLASLGVSGNALSTVSFGKEKPLDPGHNEEAWAKNRRAHFVLK